MISTSLRDTQIVTDFKRESKCTEEIFSLSEPQSTHASAFAESKKFKKLATDARAAFFPFDKNLLSVSELGNIKGIVHFSSQSEAEAVARAAGPPAAEINGEAAASGSAEAELEGQAIDGGGCSCEKTSHVVAELATGSGAYRTSPGSVCVTEEQSYRRTASPRFRSVELEERSCEQQHQRRRSWRLQFPTGCSASPADLSAIWSPTAIAETGKRTPHLEEAMCSGSDGPENSRSRQFIEDEIILADNEYESESEVFEDDECQSSAKPIKNTKKQNSKHFHCEDEDRRYGELQSSASSDWRHGHCKATPADAADVSFPAERENYLTTTLFPVTEKAAQKSVFLPQQVALPQDSTTVEKAACKSSVAEKQEFTRVLVVTRRCLRKNRYVDYVGELHFNLLQQFNALPIVVPRTGATLKQLEGYMPMHGLLLVEGEDLGEKMEPYRTHNVDLDVQQNENIQKMVVQALYPEEVLADDDRNEIEKALLERCEKDNIPVLGICRGCQMLNVFRGGSLFFDIGLQLGGQVRHLDYNNSDCHRHDLWVVSDSPLGDWFAEERAKALTDDALLLPEQVLLLQDPPSQQLAAVAAAMVPFSTTQKEHSSSSSGSLRRDDSNENDGGGNGNGNGGGGGAESSTAPPARGLLEEAASACASQKEERSLLWLSPEAQTEQAPPREQQEAVMMEEKERLLYVREDSSNEALKGNCGFTPSPSRVETTVGSGYASASSVAVSPAASLFSPCPTPRFSVSRTVAASSAAVASEEAAAAAASAQLATTAADKSRSETEAAVAAEGEALLAQALLRAQQQLLLLRLLKQRTVSSSTLNNSGICRKSSSNNVEVSIDTSLCSSARDVLCCDAKNKDFCTSSSNSSSTLQQHTFCEALQLGETPSRRESSESPHSCCTEMQPTAAARTLLEPRCCSQQSQPLQQQQRQWRENAQKLGPKQTYLEETAWLKLSGKGAANDSRWQRRPVEEAGNRLFSISVNSYHHQGVRELGRGLMPMGFTQQGVIEAFCDEKMLQQLPLLLSSDAQQQALSQERQAAADVAAQGSTAAQTAYAQTSSTTTTTTKEVVNVAQAAVARASSAGAATAAAASAGREEVRRKAEEAAPKSLFFTEDSPLHQPHEKQQSAAETNSSSQHSSTFYVGIQFHPERMLEDYRGCRRVMEAFVTACHAFRKRQHQPTPASPNIVAPLSADHSVVGHQGAAAAVHAAAAFVAAAYSNSASIASVHAGAAVTAAETRYEEGRDSFAKESLSFIT